jgi:hypothetical protein
MEEVEGIILILSCEKHRKTRLLEFGPKKNYYNGWKVIKVIGNYFLDKDYDIKDNFLYIKCEDTYLHLLKKLALSIKYLNNIFSIKQGILRCGDDLIFNEDVLQQFLSTENKFDFYGKAYCDKHYISSNIDLLKTTRVDPFMLSYYATHQNELTDQNNGMNLTLEELKKYSVRPDVWGPSGIIYYISNRSCNIIVDTMEKINYNIFHLDEFTNSYPYIIEDCGVTYIMYYNIISFINNKHFFGNKKCIVMHTNKYK